MLLQNSNYFNKTLLKPIRKKYPSSCFVVLSAEGRDVMARFARMMLRQSVIPIF